VCVKAGDEAIAPKGDGIDQRVRDKYIVVDQRTDKSDPPTVRESATTSLLALSESGVWRLSYSLASGFRRSGSEAVKSRDVVVALKATFKSLF
jgi:hypothetical protein